MILIASLCGLPVMARSQTGVPALVDSGSSLAGAFGAQTKLSYLDSSGAPIQPGKLYSDQVWQGVESFAGGRLAGGCPPRRRLRGNA